MAVEKTEIQLSVSGEEATASAMANVAKSVNGVADATRRLDTAQKASTSALADVTGKFAKFQSTIGVVAQGIGAMSATAGRATQILGATTGAVSGLSGAFGPLGLAIAAVSGAFSVYQAIVADADKATQDLTESTKDATLSLYDQIRAMQEAGRTRREQRDLLASEEGIAVRLQQAYRDLAAANMSANTSAASAARARIEALDAESRALNEAQAQREFLDRARRETEAAIAEAEAMGDVRGGRGGAGASRDRGRAEDDQWRSMIGGLTAFAPGAEDRLAAEMQAQEDWAAVSERLNEINAAGNKEMEYRNQLMAEQAALTRQSIEDVGMYASILTGPVVDGLAAAMRGEMNLAQAMKRVVSQRLQAVAIEEAVLAIVATAKAIGATILDPGSAATFWAEAATHAKASAAAGAGALVSGAIGMAAGGGGGGGGSSASAAASPTRDTSQGASGGGDKNITIYFGSPVVTATTVAELGREIKSAILVADARYGV